MNRTSWHSVWMGLLGAACLAGLASGPALATIQGIQGTVAPAGVRTFNLTAKADYIASPDGTYLYIWGFADNDADGTGGTGQAQYPGPTLIVAMGDTVVVNLRNELPEAVSLTFPGLEGPTVPVYDGLGKLRSLSAEAAPLGGSHTYTFTAPAPGTYFYQSATHMDKQIPLGLIGAIIVRADRPGRAYNHRDAEFDREYLLLLTDMDDLQNFAADADPSPPYDYAFNSTEFIPGYWFINGRMAMDTLTAPFVPWLASQPYDAYVRMHPGETILLRFINLGRDPHPFHTHGNHVKVLAHDARLLGTAANSGANLADLEFTVPMGPGQTTDGTFTWRAENLGWDIYGHECTCRHGSRDGQTCVTDPDCPGGGDCRGPALETDEWAPDHCKPIPTRMPYFTSLSYGEWFSGTTYLGEAGPLPPDLTRENLTNAFLFMWHSHRENEMTNKNDFPGGMMTLLAIEAPWVPIP